MGEAAVHLALDDELVDRLPGVVGDDVAKDLDLPGVGVDRDDRGVASARVRKRPLGIEALEHLEPFAGNDFCDGDLLRRRAAHRDDPIVDQQVGRVGFEDLAGALQQSFAQRGRRFRGRVADLDGAPAAGGQIRGRRVLGVGGGDADLLERPAEPIRGDLRGHRLMALALRGRADIQISRPVLVDAQPGRLAAAESGRLDAAGDAESDEAPVVCALGDIAQLLQRQVEQARVIAAVVDEARPAGRIAGGEGDLLWLDHVAAPQLDGRHIEDAREAIEHALGGVVAQRPPAAADEAARHRVRVDELRVHVHRGHDVGGEHVGHDDVGLAGTRSAVGAQVVHQPSPEAAELALAVGGGLDLDHGSVALGGGRAVLAARGDPLRGALQTPGGERGEDLLGKRAALGAESAADVLGDDAHVLLLDPECAGDRVAHAEHVLRRGPHLESVGVRIWGGGDGARFHRGARDARGGEEDLGGHAVGAKGALEVAIAPRLAARDVVVHIGVNFRRAFGRRRIHVAHAVERVELRGHLLGRVLRLVRGLRDDHRERLSHIVDLVAVQDRASARDHFVGAPVAQGIGGLGQVVGGPHCDDTRHRFRGVGVDGADARMGEAGAAEGDVDEVVELDVSGESTATCDQSLVLDAGHAPADVWRHAPTISRPLNPTVGAV